MTRLKKIFANEKVSASAGSGKTFSLTTRFIALACCANGSDFDPFSIIALTFTKKAAGEFLSKILIRLADAASSPEEAKKLSYAIVDILPNADKGFFLKTLRKLRMAHILPNSDIKNLNQEVFKKVLALCAKNVNRLHLSTIDSLFSTIIKQNASSLKIFAPVKVEDENSNQAKRFMLDTVAKMMSSQTLTERETSDFAELIKRANFGKERKQLRETIVSTLKLVHNVYLRNNDLSKWGQANLSGIKFKLVEWNEDEYQQMLEQLQLQLEDINEFSTIVKFFSSCGYAKLETKTSSIVEKILQHKRQGTLAKIESLPYRTKEIPFPCAELVDDMLDMLFSEHFLRLCEASYAVGKIASLYEAQYETNVRQQGNITFSDMPFILSDQERQIEKEIIEYKLDAKFKHWLFDEFQDTSQIQWDVLRNLAEEAIIANDKSFYYVGDVKQSIYAWRGATPKLFNEIFNYYNTNSELISNAKPLTVSWRSGKYVIKAINEIFGDVRNLARVFPQKAAEIFSKEFAPHSSAEELKMKKSLPSFAQLCLYDGSVNSEEDIGEVCNQILKILKKCEPLKRGISCAILVSKNSQANAIVEFLKENGYNAASELSVPIHRDRPIISIFTAILRRLAHPKNTASDTYCKMAEIDDFTDNFSDAFITNSLQKIYSEGFTSFARAYENFMAEKLGNTNAIEFKWLADCCLKLDRNGISSLDDVADFISQCKIATSAGDGVIQVMTIHKSKGLAFGMVIMPIKIENRMRNSVVEIGDTIMLSPNSTLAAMNTDLFEHLQKQRDSESFETICKLYVGATRPERALYIIAPKFSESSLKIKPEERINFTQLMLGAFNQNFKNCATVKEAKALYREFSQSLTPLKMGDEYWFKKISHPPAIEATTRLAKIENIVPIKSIKIQKPSVSSEKESAEEGTQIHAFFEKLNSPEDLTDEKINDAFDDKQLQKSIRCLFKNDDFKKFFSNANAIETNEFPVYAKRANTVISGRIDRLIVFKNGNDFSHAYIVDYKPSCANSDEYNKQLTSYKYAISKAFNIKQEDIYCFIVGYRDAKIKQI